MTIPRYRKVHREAEIERLQQVIVWRRQGLTYKKIGELLGVSLERARQLAFKSQTFAEMREPGISEKFDRVGRVSRSIDEWVNSVDPDA